MNWLRERLRQRLCRWGWDRMCAQDEQELSDAFERLRLLSARVENIRRNLG